MSMEVTVKEIAVTARTAGQQMARIPTAQKDGALIAIADWTFFLPTE